MNEAPMHPSRSIRCAATLLELCVGLAVLGTVTSMVCQGIAMGASMQDRVGLDSDLINRADRVAKQVAYQLRSADYNWITITVGPVSTYQFTLCTGLNANGPVFNQGYTLAYDSANGVLTATLTDLTTLKVLQQDVARGLRIPDPAKGILPGFQLTQLGTDVVVTGNQLQLSVTLQDRLTSGEVVNRTANSVIFLRSTMYANANLTRTVTAQTGGSGGAGAPGEAKPIISLGADTDKSTKQMTIDSNKITVNNLLIKGSIAMPTGTSASVDYTTFALTTDKQPTDVPQKTDYTLSRGWVKGENPGNKLLGNEFLISGWVDGSLTATITVKATNGQSATSTGTY
jgi:hypothetical protein